MLVTNVARSKGLRRRSKDGPNRSGKVSFFITVTRRRNSKSNGMDANTKNNAKSKTTTTNRDDDDDSNNDDSIVETTSTNKETVAVIGTLDAFGGWDSRECLQLVQTPNDADKWTGKIDLSHDDASNKTELKLVLLDQFQNVIQWSPGESFYVELPERCVNYEITIDWPVDDERLTASSTAKVEVKASDNKIETGGAWLAWDGQKPTAEQVDAMNASMDEAEKEEVVEATKDDDDDDDDENDDGNEERGAKMSRRDGDDDGNNSEDE